MRYVISLCLVVLGQFAVADYRLETVADNLVFPWSMAFLPDGSYLIAERGGALRRMSADGVISEPLQNSPATFAEGQGGYFDVVLDLDFSNNNTFYLSFAHGNKDANATRVISAQLQQNQITAVAPIFTAEPTKDTNAHYGGRLLALPNNILLLTTGDGFDYREAAQDKFSQMGKTIRIHTDGSVPADNPFADGIEGNPKVWSWGHRNPQGLALDATTDTVYLHEHGPKGGDELNRVMPGKNYGWPLTTYGINYSGAIVSPFQTLPNIEPPLTYWVPSIAPSGLAFYDGDAFPEWQGDLFVGALVNNDVRRLDMVDGKVNAEEILFSEIDERIRDIRMGPDGFLYILTDSAAGKIIRVVPR
ncbi:MAG: glucose/arabinose dehydrogenase [Candidatus Azotimanducaceae bacterium]|jgi:glucose/arabinose dehydrogenase